MAREKNQKSQIKVKNGSGKKKIIRGVERCPDRV